MVRHWELGWGAVSWVHNMILTTGERNLMQREWELDFLPPSPTQAVPTSVNQSIIKALLASKACTSADDP